MNQTPADPDYAIAPPPRKSRRLWWTLGIIIVVAILLGTCVKGGVDLYSAISARSDATVEVVERFMTEGLPSEDDPIFSRRAGVTQEALENLQDMMDQYGAVSEFSGAMCSMRSAANIDAAQSGTFADCQMTATAAHSPVSFQVGWVREDETWKLVAFHVNYSDDSVLIEKAKEFDRLSNEEGDSVQEPPSEIIAPE